MFNPNRIDYLIIDHFDPNKSFILRYCDLTDLTKFILIHPRCKIR
ncbi:hypothetical protein DBT_0798 [Dissulfuribacter thermophilus]|uniref:Uncharacterized protein n=1 Tax=Dissulfuribacter thermophilus TaxID=1156395 RepID=A0A1B9F7L2_9BACT|nr:hypothetical protein DBT_0798 [Dissulfuribacter thermophilus]